MIRAHCLFWGLAALAQVQSLGCFAATPAVDAAQLAYVERPGAALPMQVSLRESAGGRESAAGAVRLADLSAGRPLILVLGYFKCPNLCGVVRASLFRALAASGLAAGRDYALVSLSIDPAESVDDAADARRQDLGAFPLPGEASFVHYVTGSPEAIRDIASAAGFRDQPAPGAGREWIHPAGIVFATSGGTLSSYLLGVGYHPEAVRLAVERAHAHVIAAVAAPLLLLCFHFDPTTGRYSLEVLKLMRFGAVLTVLVLGGVLYLLFRRERSAP
jgi:protein SCO1/2